MKGPSWADQTAEEEEELEQRRRENAAATSRPQTIQPTPAAQPQRAPASAYQPSSSSIPYAQRAGAPVSSPTDRGSNQGRGFPQDSRDRGGFNDRSSGQMQRGGNQRENTRDSRGDFNRDQGPSSGPKQPKYGGYGGALEKKPEPVPAPSFPQSSPPPARDQWQRGEQPRGGYQEDRRTLYQPSRDNRDSRDNRGARDNRRPEHAPVVRETGIIATVKTDFGFIRAAEREAELFFHFQDYPASAANPPRKGDEVSFRVVNDPRDGRPRAQQLEVLPKGSVVFEQVLDEGVEGIVVREMRGQFNQAARKGKRVSLADSLAQGRTEAYGGKIKRITAGANPPASSPTASSSSATETEESYEFSERDLADPNVLLFVGDRIKFNIFVEKKSQRKGATQVALIEPNPVGRERGRVVSVKDAFGFLEVEKEINEDDDEDVAQQQPSSNRFDRRGPPKGEELFFHFSELIDQTHTPQVGDEFSFKIDASPAEGHKVSAQRIAVLPKGSLNSKEVGKETLTGTVTQEIRYEKIAAAPVASPVASPNPAAQGDSSAAAAASPVSSPVASPTTPAAIPGESPNPLSRQEYPASSSKAGGRSAQRKVIPGIITYTDPSGQTLELPFRESDLQPDRRGPILVLKGDQVQFHLLTLRTRKGEFKRATQISGRQDGWTKQGREQGIVTMVKEGFAFVDGVTRSEKIFLHASNIKGGVAAAARADALGGQQGGKQESLYVGLEVEFNVQSDQPGKFSAIRALTLAPGTVQFEEVLPQVYQAKVSKGIKRSLAHRGSNAVKAGSDSSSYSKNDLRRDQANAPVVAQGRHGERGEKGEVLEVVPVSGDASSSADAPPALTQSTFSFYDIDVLDPAAGLDNTSLVVGDTVQFQLKKHKRTGNLTATKVTLQSMQKEGRESGQVIRIKGAEGVGFLLTLTRAQPIAFFLRDSPLPKGTPVQVGDCFEFSIAEPNLEANKKNRERGGTSHAHEDKPHAVRLTPLPKGSVEVEKTDRTVRLRGFIAQVPERGKGASKPGTIIRLTGANTAREPVHHETTTLASMWTHPAAWPVAGAEPFQGVYNAGAVHPAYLALEAKAKVEKKEESKDEKYSFSFSDVAGQQFLSKGDLLDFYVSERTVPVVSKRAVEITLAPLQGVVERVEALPNQSSNDAKVYSGFISVFNPQAHHTEETFFFHSKDVSAPSSTTVAADGSASSSSAAAPSPSASPPLPFELNVGDTVEFTEIVYNAEKKKRQAKGITRIKESNLATKSAVRGTKRVAGTAIVYATRFARGPDATGIGFTNGRKRVVVPSPAASPAPAAAESK